ncbi:LURP-one-related family protein [Enterococcus sp. BWM-S5]|uniref:LURP-one-related family protein n=1 Tax=Enterococcus larvae TaxID=2794352 RepID=A0ABS4CKY7_9ENTE|nr:LURP-one-related family protein [Enterococcus larvae]MBP1047264.1 LURP-one-related family protein [Enterococcus larvae]
MKKLFIKQQVFSLGGHFTVKDENEQDRYIVEGSFLSIPKTFTISDVHGQTIGTITKKVFSFLPKFFIEIDGEETLTIEKELTLFKSRYHIDAKELDVQGDWWNKNFEIVRNGQTVATISEKWFTWGDSFEVDIYDEALEHTIISLVIAIDFVKQEENNAAASSGSTS